MCVLVFPLAPVCVCVCFLIFSKAPFHQMILSAIFGNFSIATCHGQDFSAFN